ncbi:hypothetical protein BGZ81_003929 [Podila clonocystis]|nr:hypothetical protein BGZ81_003929 [Podila clonocystis]
MSILHKTARQSSSLAFLWRSSSLAQVRTISIGAYNFHKDTLKTAPGWDDDNATESEADVKADREPLPKNVEELQRESVESLHRSKAGRNIPLKTAPAWSEENATESEMDVKADREPLPKNVESLQSKSIEHLHGSNAAQKQHGNHVNTGIHVNLGIHVNHSNNHAKGKKAQDVDDHVDADKGA